MTIYVTMHIRSPLHPNERSDPMHQGQSSVDRGFMRAVSYRCYAAED